MCAMLESAESFPIEGAGSPEPWLAKRTPDADPEDEDLEDDLEDDDDDDVGEHSAPLLEDGLDRRPEGEAEADPDTVPESGTRDGVRRERPERHPFDAGRD